MSQQSSGYQSSKQSAGTDGQMMQAGQLIFDSPRALSCLKLMLPIAAQRSTGSGRIDLMPGLPFDDVAVLFGAMALFVKLATDTIERQQRQQSPGQSSGQGTADDTVVDTTWKIVE